MQGRLAARDLQQVRLAFSGDQGVHHRVDGGEIAAVLRRRRRTRETGRTGEIAVRVDIKDSQARVLLVIGAQAAIEGTAKIGARSEEHTSELQSLMSSSYAVFCLK